MPRSRSGRRTDYEWISVGDFEDNVDLGVATGTFGSTGLTIARPLTLTRLRGRVAVTLDAGAVNENAMILCGVMILTADKFVGGGGAPELFVQAGSDEASWVWQGSLYVSAGDEAAVNENWLSQSLEIDSKAMRRMKPSETLAFVFQAPTELVRDASGTYNVTWHLHALFGS